ncbi:hypothetical protein UlMin_025557 [Ulmus minor]
MIEISQRCPRVADYLENEVGFQKWSRCHFPGLRYNVTTTNMFESLNNMLVTAREFPYVALLDVIQEKMSKWWNERRIMSMSLTSPLTPNQENELRPRFMGSNGLLTIQLNPVTYQVFDIDRLPCAHTIAAALHARVGVYSLVSPYYTKEYYMLAYQQTIYPVGSQSQWDVPDEVVSRVVLPREVKDRKMRRPKNSRYPSAGEFRKRKSRCGKCGQLGHYKKKCRSEAGSTEGNPPTNVTAL